MVLVFVGVHGAAADTAICNLNRSLIRFGELRIQLLVVVDGYPSEVAERLGVTVPLITDDGLADELNAHIDEQGRLASVVVGNDGRVLSVVRQLPTDDQALAILATVESLSTQFPDRFTVLPDGDENAERIEDATSAQTEFSAASLRQQLSWITGDRDREAKALADTLPETGSPDAVLVAAKKAVADAHSDASVSAHDPVTSDVANAADVITKLDADEPADDGEPLDSPLDPPA